MRLPRLDVRGIARLLKVRKRLVGQILSTRPLGLAPWKCDWSEMKARARATVRPTSRAVAVLS